MVCPIFGAPAFVARLIPIYSLSGVNLYSSYSSNKDYS